MAVIFKLAVNQQKGGTLTKHLKTSVEEDIIENTSTSLRNAQYTNKILRILTVIFHTEEGFYTRNVFVNTQF